MSRSVEKVKFLTLNNKKIGFIGRNSIFAEN